MAVLVVFDCMVFLQAAARSTSIAAACLELAEQGHVELCLSEAILIEISDVLKRPQIQERFRSLSNQRVDDFVAAIRRFGHVYPDVGLHFNYPRDPKDEPYLNLAIEAKARYLASRDNDLLDLRSSNDPVSVDFRRQFPSLLIVEPVEFLRAIQRELLGGENPLPPGPRDPGRGR